MSNKSNCLPRRCLPVKSPCFCLLRSEMSGWWWKTYRFSSWSHTLCFFIAQMAISLGSHNIQVFLGFHNIQAFLNFVAMACLAKVADFQARWGIGPCEPQPEGGIIPANLFPIAELSTVAVVSSVVGLVLSLYCIQLNSTEPTTPLSPLAYLLDIGHGLLFAATMTCIHGIVGCVRFDPSVCLWNESFLRAEHRVATTVSAFTQPGCRNPRTDPHRQLGPRFRGQLRGWCNTKKAGSIFVCFVFGELRRLAVRFFFWSTKKKLKLGLEVRWLHRCTIAVSLVYRDWKAPAVLSRHSHSRSQLSQVSVNDGDSVASVSIQMEEAPQPLPFCSICQDFIPVGQSTTLPPCEHTFCQECIKQHVCAQLQENRFPINCPDCVADPATQEASSE